MGEEFMNKINNDYTKFRIISMILGGWILFQNMNPFFTLSQRGEAKNNMVGYKLQANDLFDIIISSEVCNIEMVGGRDYDGYGAWPLCTNLLPSSQSKKLVVYSFGIGSDISFDKKMVEDHNANVWCYDPTIQSDSFHKLAQDFEYKEHLSFVQIGLGNINVDKNKNGAHVVVVPLYKSQNPLIGSLSMTLVDGYKSDPYMYAPIMSIETIMKLNNHAWIDVLKLDIETAEFDLFMTMDLATIPASQVLIEFHARLLGKNGDEMQKKIYQRFKDAGFSFEYESASKEECVFVRRM